MFIRTTERLFECKTFVSIKEIPLVETTKRKRFSLKLFSIKKPKNLGSVYKQKRSLSIPIVKPSSLLTTIFIDSTDISSYLNCTNRRFSSYEMSPLKSSRYTRCIQSNKSGYNIIKVIPSQFQNIIF